MDPQNQSDQTNQSTGLNPTSGTNSSGNFTVANAQSTAPITGNTNPLPENPAIPPTPNNPPASSSNETQNIANLDNTKIKEAQNINQPSLDPNSPLNPFDNNKKKFSPKIFKHFLIPIIIGLVLIVLIIGIVYLFKGRSSKEAGDISMWGFEDPVIWQPTFEKFTQEKRIKINYTRISPNNFEKMLLEAFATKKTPDIFPLRSDWFEKHRNKVVPTTLSAEIPQYLPYAKETLVKDGNLYGITISQDSLAIFYNKDLAGTLNPADFQYWDQIKSWAGPATNKSGTDISIASIPLGIGENINYGADIISAILIQNNAQMTNSENTAVEYDKVTQKVGVGDYYPGTEGLDFFTSFAKPDSTNYSWNGSLPASYEAFGSGKVKTYLGYARDMDVFKNKYPLLNYDVLPLPQIRNSEKNTSIAQFWSYSVSKDSPRPKNSWKFLQFLSQPEIIKTVDTALKVPSPYVDVVSTDKLLNVFEIQNKTATNWKKFDQNTLDNFLINATNDVVKNNQSPKVAITNATKNSNDYISKKITLRKGNLSSDDRPAYRIWTLDYEDISLEECVKSFVSTKKYSIISSVIPSAELEEIFLEESANDTGPDILYIPQSQIQRWVNRVYSFFNNPDRQNYVKQNLIKASYDNCIIKERFYCLSIHNNLLGLAYNSKITRDNYIHNAPMTWDELTSNINTIQEDNKDIAGIAMGEKNTTNAPDILALIMSQVGVQMNSIDKTISTFHLTESGSKENKAQKALEFYNSFKNTNPYAIQDFELFKQGKLAYIFVYWDQLSNLVTEDNYIPVKYAPVPQMSLDAKAVDISRNLAVVIPKRSTKTALTLPILWDLAEYNKSYASRNSWSSVTIEDYEPSRAYSGNPFTKIKNNAIDIYKGGYPEIYDNAFRQIINGSITLEQAGEIINKSWQQK